MGESAKQSSKSSFLVWSIAIAGIGFIVWLIVPDFIKAHAVSASNPCVNNLRQFDGAKNEWALETGKTNGMICTAEDIKPYVQLNAQGKLPRCPSGGKYNFGKVGEPPTCSLGTNVIPPHVLPQPHSGDR
jgi:hypothetical protein